jgi:tetratricopeptide (TPR) repeat protein
MKSCSLCASVLLLALGTLFAQGGDLAAKSQRAKQAMTVGKFQEAAALYGELVRALPENPGLRMNLALALHSAGQYQEAIGQFRAVLKRQPDSNPAWLMLGLAHLKLGQPDRAVEPLERVVKAEPGNKIARLELAEAFTAVGRPRLAAEQFKELTKLDPSDPKAWQGLGLSYIALSQQAFAELEKMAPDSAYRDVLLARSLANRNQLNSAFRLYREALAKAPELRGIHDGIAEVYLKTGHPDWAEVERRRERDLPAPDCNAESLECDFLSGRSSRLLEAAEKFKSVESYYWQAQIYAKLSEECFAQLSKMPPSGAIHDLMAEAYRIQGKYDLSAQEWRKALERTPRDRRLEQGLARALWLNRDYKNARPLLERLTRQEPESAELNFQLGDTLLSLDTTQQAVPYLETAVKIAPEHKAAHALLGRAYLRLGRPEQAITHLKAALDLDEEGSIYYQLAQAYQKAGQSQLAEQTLRKFQEISSTHRAKRPRLDEEYQITPPE